MNRLLPALRALLLAAPFVLGWAGLPAWSHSYRSMQPLRDLGRDRPDFFDAGQTQLEQHIEALLLSQRGLNRPDFFEEGQEQLEQQIQELQQPESPALTIEAATAQQWQPLLSREGGFVVWTPPGTLTEASKVVETTSGDLNFRVLAKTSEQARFIVAYSEPLVASQLQNIDALYDALLEAILAETEFVVVSEQPISLEQNSATAAYTGRELTLRQADEMITFRIYLIEQRLYVLGASQPFTETIPEAVSGFLDSFQLLQHSE